MDEWFSFLGNIFDRGNRVDVKSLSPSGQMISCVEGPETSHVTPFSPPLSSASRKSKWNFPMLDQFKLFIHCHRGLVGLLGSERGAPL